MRVAWAGHFLYLFFENFLSTCTMLPPQAHHIFLVKVINFVDIQSDHIMKFIASKKPPPASVC